MDDSSSGSRSTADAASRDAGSREESGYPSRSSRWSDSTTPRTASSAHSDEGEIRCALAEWLTIFSPDVAHRLRNELMILMNSEYGLRQLRGSKGEPDPREAWVESARSSINRSVQLCESLAEVGLARARRRIVSVDCVKLVRAATTLAEHSYMKRGFKIDTALPEQRITVESDPEFVREVVLGLVGIGLPEEGKLPISGEADQTARTVRVGVRSAREGGACFFVERAAGSSHPDDARVREIATTAGAQVECVEGDHGSDRLQVTVFDRPTEEDGESPDATRRG